MEKVFDQPHALLINEKRKDFMNRFVPELVRSTGAVTALDAGCGVGHFTDFLSGMFGEDCVEGFDFREENVAEARKRHPEGRYSVLDIEQADRHAELEKKFDMALCIGLLYHLENPFKAIRNLAWLTKKFLIIESVVTPLKLPSAVLIQEGEGIDQAPNYLAMRPSELFLITTLYAAGFSYVYQLEALTDHVDFKGRLERPKKRLFLVASHVELFHPLLKVAKARLVRNTDVAYRKFLYVIRPLYKFFRK